MYHESQPIDNRELDRNIEIIHKENFDVVVNTHYDSYHELEQDLDQILNAIQNRAHHTLIRFAYPENDPKYFIKERAHASKSIEDFALLTGDIKNTQLAFSSITNEVKLSDTINEVIESDQAQKIARRLGYDSLDYLPIIAGVADRDRIAKFGIYRYVPDETNKGIAKHDKGYGFAAQMTDRLRDLFFNAGINPYDLRTYQFIEDKQNNKIYLIDTEGYFTTKK